MTKAKTAKTEPKTREQEQAEQLQEIGRNAMAAIAEMVAALECDYDRLEELRDERDAWVTDDEELSVKRSEAQWAQEFPDEAEELADLVKAAGDCASREDAEQRITDDPLSLQFRSGWVNSREEMEPEEFYLLLSTGGPAVRIVGDIDRGSASNPRLETQDWFTQWTEYREQDTAILETYCNCFCFEV